MSPKALASDGTGLIVEKFDCMVFLNQRTIKQSFWLWSKSPFFYACPCFTGSINQKQAKKNQKNSPKPEFITANKPRQAENQPQQAPETENQEKHTKTSPKRSQTTKANRAKTAAEKPH